MYYSLDKAQRKELRRALILKLNVCDNTVCNWAAGKGTTCEAQIKSIAQVIKSTLGLTMDYKTLFN